MAGASPEADGLAAPSRSTRVPVAIAVLAGAATIASASSLGPLLDLASDAGAALL